MKSMTEQFIDWVGKQDPEAAFDPWDAHNCAGCQFLRATGMPVYLCSVVTWLDTEGGRHELPMAIQDAIDWACNQTGLFSGVGVTFGALADRLSA